MALDVAKGNETTSIPAGPRSCTVTSSPLTCWLTRTLLSRYAPACVHDLLCSHAYLTEWSQIMCGGLDRARVASGKKLIDCQLATCCQPSLKICVSAAFACRLSGKHGLYPRTNYRYLLLL